jgi:hypothetical protein
LTVRKKVAGVVHAIHPVNGLLADVQSVSAELVIMKRRMRIEAILVILCIGQLDRV